MSSVRNQVQLIGHLGIDPEVIRFKNGDSLTKLRIATSENYKTQEGWKENTQWHNLILRAQLGVRAAKVLKKGDHVLIKGRISYRSYTNTVGKEIYITEIEVYNFILLDKRPKEEQTSNENEAEIA